MTSFMEIMARPWHLARKSVRCLIFYKRFKMYLAGNGSQKIKKQLEKDGDLTATGKSRWYYATISHTLKNRLYCGELEYRKEYVPDYLEQKRAKNNGELDRVIVEGRHQPIVTKEEFERVQYRQGNQAGVLVSGRYGHGNPKKPVNPPFFALHRSESYIILVCF